MHVTTDSVEHDAAPPPVRIQPFTIEDDLEPIIMAWASAFTEPPNGPRNPHELHRQLLHYMVFPRFTGLVARDASDLVLGMIFGYSNEPGQWWRECVAKAMGPRMTKRYLDDSFCLMELGVVPAARRQRVGQALVQELGRRQPHPRMLLSTRSDNEPGLRFYASTGWHQIIHEMSFGWNFPPYAILSSHLATT